MGLVESFVHAYRAADHTIRTYHNNDGNRATYIWNPVIDIWLKMNNEERREAVNRVISERITTVRGFDKHLGASFRRAIIHSGLRIALEERGHDTQGL
jgi:hypothetical protein